MNTERKYLRPDDFDHPDFDQAIAEFSETIRQLTDATIPMTRQIKETALTANKDSSYICADFYLEIVSLADQAIEKLNTTIAEARAELAEIEKRYVDWQQEAARRYNETGLTPDDDGKLPDIEEPSMSWWDRLRSMLGLASAPPPTERSDLRSLIERLERN
jgi:hypothetical protein